MMIKKIITRIKTSNWVQNVSIVLVGKIISAICFQLFDILVARKLNVDEYSEWSFFYSILSILFYIGWFGINMSTRVYISRADGYEKKAEYVKSSLEVRFLISIFVTLVILLAANYMSEILGYPDKYPNLRLLIYLGAFIVFINTYIDYFKSVYQAYENFMAMSIVTIMEYCGYLVFALIFLLISNDVKMVALAYFVAECIALFINYIYVHYKISIKNIAFDINRCKQILQYAMPMAVIGIGCILLSEIDIVMLGLLGSKVDISTYSIGKHICDKAIHINEAIVTGTVTPLAIINADNFEEKKNQFMKINNINSLTTFLTSLVLFTLGTFGISILYGDSYGATSKIIYMLIPYYIIYAVSNLYGRILDYHEGAWTRSKWFLSAVVLNAILDYFMIPLLGAKGAAISTVFSLIPYVIYTKIAVNRLFKRGFYLQNKK